MTGVLQSTRCAEPPPPKNLCNNITIPDQVWGASPSGGDPHVSADSPPSSHWAFKTSTPSVHSADSEDTLADLLDVKEETPSSSGVGVRRKRRKSKSPKFTVGISLSCCIKYQRITFVAGGDAINGEGEGAACHHNGDRGLVREGPIFGKQFFSVHLFKLA